MPNVMKSSFVWQFAGGFVLGAVGLVALHPGQSETVRAAPVAATAR